MSVFAPFLSLKPRMQLISSGIFTGSWVCMNFVFFFSFLFFKGVLKFLRFSLF